jgi:hypothetical protein
MPNIYIIKMFLNRKVDRRTYISQIVKRDKTAAYREVLNCANITGIKI